MVKLLYTTILLCAVTLGAVHGQMAPQASAPYFYPTPLQRTVNSAFPEVAPMISCDGATLYFTRRAHPQNMGAQNSEDIWVAKRLPSGKWGRAINLGGPVNNRLANRVMGVAPNGKTLYVTNRYDANYSGIARSRLVGRFWEEPIPLAIEAYQNLDSTLAFHINPSEDILLLAIHQPTGIGQKDIYVSFKRADQRWTAPKNLGAAINTAGDEAHVFLGADNKTLYFATDGRSGMGGLDLFMSRRLDDSWTHWSVPQNLGPTINTSSDDRYFSLPAAGTPAYLVQADSSGKQNIFHFPLPEVFRPEPVTLVNGYVEIPTSAAFPEVPRRLVSADLSQPGQLRKVAVEADGSFSLVVPYGKNIGLQTEGEGYYALSESLEFSDTDLEELDVNPNAPLEAVELDQAYRLRNEALTQLQLRLQQLDNEMTQLQKEQELYRKELANVQKLALLRKELADQRDPELVALQQHYQTYTQPAADTIKPSVRTTTPPSTAAEDEELAKMKKRFRAHYEVAEYEQEEEPEEEMLWREAKGFEDFKAKVRAELVAELAPEVQLELRKDLVDEVHRELLANTSERSQAILRRDADNIKEQVTQSLSVTSFTRKGIEPADDALPEWQQKLRSDLRVGIQDEVKEELRNTLKEDIRRALRGEMEYLAKKNVSEEIRVEIDEKLSEQVQAEQQEGISPPTIEVTPEVVEPIVPLQPVTYQEAEKEIILVPITEGALIPLNNIFFQPNTARFKTASYAELDQVLQFLQKNGSLVVEIGGHTNGWLSHSLSLQLSNQRAEAVKQYLVKNGIKEERVVAKGYGKTQPIADNSTVEGRKKNQRIAMRVLGAGEK